MSDLTNKAKEVKKLYLYAIEIYTEDGEDSCTLNLNEHAQKAFNQRDYEKIELFRNRCEIIETRLQQRFFKLFTQALSENNAESLNAFMKIFEEYPRFKDDVKQYIKEKSDRIVYDSILNMWDIEDTQKMDDGDAEDSGDGEDGDYGNNEGDTGNEGTGDGGEGGNEGDSGNNSGESDGNEGGNEGGGEGNSGDSTGDSGDGNGE